MKKKNLVVLLILPFIISLLGVVTVNVTIKTFEKVGLKPEVRKEVRNILADYTDRYLGVDVLRGIEEPEVK